MYKQFSEKFKNNRPRVPLSQFFKMGLNSPISSDSLSSYMKYYWAASWWERSNSCCFIGCMLFSSVTTRSCYNLTPPLSPPDPTLGLEAQQKYSTGYIQCMHEVHNMLLTCEWMDKTMGSRLLNHLLKSLPRSTDERPLQASPRRDAPLPAGTPPRGDPRAGRQLQREGPTRPERPALHSSHLGMLEMWRPWWPGGSSVVLDHLVLCIL